MASVKDNSLDVEKGTQLIKTYKEQNSLKMAKSS